MQMVFDETKATQIAAYFLKLANRPIQHLALIKLLYKLDRKAIELWGVPVTTDRFVSMKYGPVVRNIYSLITDTKPTFWSTHVERASPTHVQLLQDPGTSELSKAEEALAEEIFQADGAKDGFALAEECHRDFPEWNDPTPYGSTPIEVSDILSTLQKSEDEIAHTESMFAIQRASSLLAISR
jgi:uncharacterized phage-associated protein